MEENCIQLDVGDWVVHFFEKTRRNLFDDVLVDRNWHYGQGHRATTGGEQLPELLVLKTYE